MKTLAELKRLYDNEVLSKTDIQNIIVDIPENVQVDFDNPDSVKNFNNKLKLIQNIEKIIL